MRLSQVSRLFTREDRGHVHKVLGFTALGHYVYRVVRCVRSDDHALGFVAGDPWMLFWILVHLALSGTSLIFHIPRNRVRKLPMIWPEFRVHSILFAYRSLAIMLCLWQAADGDGGGGGDGARTTQLLVAGARGAIVMGTIVGADLATAHYRRMEALKPDETTMRSMPFPDGTPSAVVKGVNFYYSVSQVLATMNMLFSVNANRPFAALFPIQIAAFLMTLVRKGVLTAGEWHASYAGALGVNYVYAAVASGECSVPLATYWVIAAAFVLARFGLRANKYLLWSGVVGYYWAREIFVGPEAAIWA